MTERKEASGLRDLAGRYVELLRQALLNETCLEAEVAYYYARECLQNRTDFRPDQVFDVRRNLEALYCEVAEARHNGRHLRRDLNNVGFAATMIGRPRMEHLEHCIRDVVDNGVPGDLIECGAWRGGAAIFMRGVLAALDVPDRVVWVADSFRGLPQPNRSRGDPDLAADRFPQLAVDLAQVRTNFERFGLLDAQVRFLEGWFEDTLEAADIERLAVLRIDADYHDSTMTALTALYDKVALGGHIIVDDYSLIPSCKAAVDAFRAQRGIAGEPTPVDADCVFWTKEAGSRT